jgi:arsenate reductase-like glutaredoxin family protein
MQPERVVRSISDLKKAMADLQREGRTVLNVDGRKVILLPWDQTDDLTDDEFEAMLSRPMVKERLDKAVAQADAGLGIADAELDDLFDGKKE